MDTLSRSCLSVASLEDQLVSLQQLIYCSFLLELLKLPNVF